MGGHVLVLEIRESAICIHENEESYKAEQEEAVRGKHYLKENSLPDKLEQNFHNLKILNKHSYFCSPIPGEK